MPKKTKTKRFKSDFKKSGSGMKIAAIIGILALAIGVPLGIAAGVVYFTVGPGAVGPGLPGETPPPEKSYAKAIDFVSLEFVNDIAQVQILGNDVDINDADDRYDETNYETAYSTDSFEDLAEDGIDLSEYTDIIIKIDPSNTTYWAPYDIVATINNVNTNFTCYQYHRPSDMYGNVLDDTDGSAFDGTDGNYTTYGWFPKVSSDELHQEEDGDWEYDEALSDYSDAVVYFIKNQNNFRCWQTSFDLDNDQADHSESGSYTDITDTFMIKIDMNDTIGTSTSDTGVNITLSDQNELDFEVHFGTGDDDDKIYLVSQNTFHLKNGIFELGFEFQSAVNITTSAIYWGPGIIAGNYWTDVAVDFTSIETIYSAS